MAESDNFEGLNGGQNSRVGNVAEFYNDVYVYGTLYADLFGNADFGDGLNLNIQNLNVAGIATFDQDVFINAELYTDYLTVKHRFNVGSAGTVFVAISSQKDADDGQTAGRVGIGTTQPDARFQVGAADTSFVVTENGLVGIGTTVPGSKFQVGVECVHVLTDPCRVGIGTSLPADLLQIGKKDNSVTFARDSGTGKVSVGVGSVIPVGRFQVDTGDKIFIVDDEGRVGIGSTYPSQIPGYSEAANGDVKLNVEGTVKIDRHIIDSSDSVGFNGYYLNRDGNGIRWVQASPVSLDGMYVQDEHVDLPLGGTAQLFQWLNFTQKNSLGLGTDTTIPIPDPNNPTAIARIQTQDYWGHVNTQNDSPIYRMTKVGIYNNNPAVELDVTGQLHVTNNVDFDADLNVDGNTKIDQTLDVDGLTTFNDTTDSTFSTNGAVHIDGGLGISKRLNIGGKAIIEDSTESVSCTTGALVVYGGLGVSKNLNVCGSQDLAGTLRVNSTEPSTNCTTGAVVIGGGLGVAGDLNVCGNEHIFATTQSTDKDTGALIVEGGVGIEKNLNVGQNTKLIGTLELENQIIDYDNGVGYDSNRTQNDYRLSSTNNGVKWRPAGVETENIIYVTRDGDDGNSGFLEGDAKRTIGAAAAIAQEGDTIKVRSGVYNENNPIGLRDNITITGEDIRLVTIVPNNINKDVFHVRRGCLIENLNFAGATIVTNHQDCAAVAFPPTQTYIDAGVSYGAVTGYTVAGPANEGSGGRWRSPYVRNCTNFMTGSIGMRINGHHADAAYTGTNDLGQDLKSMVCDAFTQYNEAGIGVSISNNAYAQLVSIFTIGCKIAIGCTSGGQCDLTNSNSSFGTFGLVADGTGVVEFDGDLSFDIDGESDFVVLNNTRDFNNPRQFRTPFDGQAAYFHLNMSDYNDTPSTAQISEPMQFIRSVTVVDGGNPGDYNAGAPPIITATIPEGPESILAEFSPNVSAAGTITSVDVINAGRNFLPTQNVVLSISGTGSGQVIANMDPILFTVSEATEVAAFTGITTVTFNEFIPYPVAAGSKMELVRMSRIITSSHSFEYVGAGTNINTANPFQGGKPIPENEVIAINGGQVPFTSTDQKGNFRIGDGLTIDQTTSTIRGRDFNRAIQAQLTPLILALK